MNRDEICSQNPILRFLGSRFVKIKGEGQSVVAHQCPKANHAETHWCVSVDIRRNVWYCNDCEIGGSVIDWVMQAENLSAGDAMEKLSGGSPHSSSEIKPVELCAYDYTDENGILLFQVVRYVPKTFRQRHKRKGEWVYNMQGVRRVLYQLPKVVSAEIVIVCEGEKDCDNLAKFGYVTTCNAMGANKWLESYSDSLKDKRVYVWPDNDDPGREHADLVTKSLLPMAKAVFLISVEEKDSSDFIALDAATASERIAEAVSSAKLLNSIESLPILSFLDLELEYQEHVKQASATCLELRKWLPSFRCVRPLVPGELVSVLASTGIGKTAILQNIALKADPLVTLIFELELPGSLMFERFCQIDHGFTGEQIFESYRDGTALPWGEMHIKHLFFCMKSRIGGFDMERIINRAELRIGKRPALVMVDYVGLMEASGSSRYERISEIAESLKVIAKSTNTIIIFASQIARKEKDNKSKEIYLHDAKDSGSIENSSGLVLGAWREDDEGKTMIIKILKNTKGYSGGKKIVCNFNGPTLQITERSHISPSDIPPTTRTDLL